jgi:hypothetical protein
MCGYYYYYIFLDRKVGGEELPNSYTTLVPSLAERKIMDFDNPWDDPSFKKSVRRMKRGELIYLTSWRKILNPYRKHVLFPWRHRFGKWKHLNDK